MARFFLTTTAVFIAGIPVLALGAPVEKPVEAMLDNITAVSLPQSDNGSIEPIIARLINVFLSVFGIIFLSIMLFGGYTWMKAQGREDEVNRAKDMIKAAIIGMGVVFIAYTLTYFAVSSFWTAAKNSSGGAASAVDSGN